MNRTVNRKFSDGFTNEFYQILKKEIMLPYSMFSENRDKETIESIYEDMEIIKKRTKKKF